MVTVVSFGSSSSALADSFGGFFVASEVLAPAFVLASAVDVLPVSVDSLRLSGGGPQLLSVDSRRPPFSADGLRLSSAKDFLLSAGDLSFAEDSLLSAEDLPASLADALLFVDDLRPSD
jgi:hypothetical protein